MSNPQSGGGMDSRVMKEHFENRKLHPADECLDRGCDTAADAPYAYAHAQRLADAKPDPRQGGQQACGSTGGSNAGTQNEAARRKATPIYSGVIAYFPHAIEAVARVSKAGNDQHNPGEPLHWAKEKSTDEPDCLMRHMTDHAKGNPFDTDGELHLAKAAWRALANLERFLTSLDYIKRQVMAEEQKRQAARQQEDAIRLKMFEERNRQEAEISKNFHTLSIYGVVASSPNAFWEAICEVSTPRDKGCERPKLCRHLSPLGNGFCERALHIGGLHAYNHNGYVAVWA